MLLNPYKIILKKTTPVIKTGIDIVFIPKFKKSVARSEESFLNRIFHSSELKNKKIPHLAGLFAAKEAIMKTSIVKIGKWKDIEIKKGKLGQPRAILTNKKTLGKVKLIDISISHHENYAVAIAIVVLS